MSDQIKQVGAGPFAIGDRVYVERFDSAGTITEARDPEVIRAFSGAKDAGELRAVTRYVVELDNGIERGIADRDGQLAHI